MPRSARHRPLIRPQILLAVLCLFLSAPAWGQPDPFAPAKQAIEENKLGLARMLVGQVLAKDPHSIEGRFLLGQIEDRSQNYKGAIEIYRAILSEQPSLLRVRLELARDLFLDRQYDQARDNFNIVLQTPDLPAGVRLNVENYLDQIRGAVVATKDYTFSLSIAGAYDSDANAATNTSTITILGLPFTLAKEALQQAGYGAAITAGGEYDPRLTEDWTLRVGGTFYRNEYQGGQLDDMNVRGFAGAQYNVTPKLNLSLLGEYGDREFANIKYNYGGGPRLEVSYLFGDDKFRFTNALEYLDLTYPNDPFLSGHYITDTSYLVYALNAQSYLRGIVSATRQNTSFTYWRNTAGQIGLGYHLDYGAWTFEAEPDVIYARYDTPFPLFNTTRIDRIYAGRLSVYGPAVGTRYPVRPFVNYQFTRDDSNISIFTFTRHQVQVGLTVNF